MSTTPVSPGTVPMPVEWAAAGQSRSGLYGALLGLVGVGILVLLGLDVAAGEAGTDTVVFGVSTLLLFALAGAGLYRARWPGRRTPLVATDGGTGLRFDYGRTPWWLMVVTQLALAPLAATLLGTGLHGLSQGGGADAVLLVPLGGLGVAWTGYWLLCLLTGRLRRGAVLLTADGVTNRTWSGDVALPWDRVAGVGPVDANGPLLRVLARPGQGATWTPRMALFGGRERRLLPDLVVLPMLVEGDAALLAHAVGWYFEHPDDRTELASGAAADRVRAGRAVVSHRAFGGGA